MLKKKTIKELRKNVLHLLLDLDYSDCIIMKVRSCCNKLEEYAKSKGEEYYSIELADNFLHDVYGIIRESILPRQHHDRIRTIQMLTDYYLHGTILVKMHKRKYIFPKAFGNVVEKYLQYRIDNGLSQSRRGLYYSSLEMFTLFLEGKGIKEVSEITPQVLKIFIEVSFIQSKSAREDGYRVIRLFLRYCYYEGYIERDLSACLPTIKRFNENHIPSVYTPDEVRRLLKCIDRENPIGKRAYAITIAIARLGLRVSDIANLQFDNIDWERSEVRLIQTKTKEPLKLALLPDVGEAIIDYLKHGRPPYAKTNTIFVNHVAPYQKMTPSGIYCIISSAINNAGIEVKGRKTGPHALRHSLASKLLAENTPLPIISEILGHKTTESTKTYLKVDFEHLRECALEVG